MRTCGLSLLVLLANVVAVEAAGRDLYKILGVPKNADDAAIKKAYRKGAIKYHPDKAKGDKKEAEQKFSDLAHAYEVRFVVPRNHHVHH